MKTYLTTQQVNKNLQQLFPNKPIQCTKADIYEYKPYDNSNYTAKYFYYIIETPNYKLAIGEDKKVYAVLAEEEMQKYKEERERFNMLHKEIEIFGETYTEWINKAYKENKEAKEQCEMLLIATGYKQPKKEETTEQKLRRVMSSNYANFYKIAKAVKITGYEFKKHERKHFDVLVIHHSTGSFSFPITCLMGNTTVFEDTFVQDAFCELLNISNPYTLAELEEIKVPELSKVSVNNKGQLTRSLSVVRRLRTFSKQKQAA